jgi:5-deoxy-glucuronate isomerase
LTRDQAAGSIRAAQFAVENAINVPTDLLVRPRTLPGLLQEPLSLPAEAAGFEFLSFSVLRLGAGERWQGHTEGRELALVFLGGRAGVESTAGRWPSIGGRANVFAGPPHALYLPIATRFGITAETPCEIALCYAKADQACPALLVTPDMVEVEIRGGGNATRRIHHLLKPEFRAQRLMVVEVYTPGGNWSSYPPHKHDVHRPPEEVDLEEIYYYQVDRPEGYAIQKVYTLDGRLDLTLTVRDGELVIVPEGYHPVVAAHGYDVYYLNALAGSARSMAASDDPDYAWVRAGWKEKDPRAEAIFSRGGRA